MAEEIALERLTALRARPLMKSVAEEFVRASQERVLCEPVLQRLLARIGGRSGVERQLVRLLDALRALPLDEHGYAPGNITNLLRLHRGELAV